MQDFLNSPLGVALGAIVGIVAGLLPSLAVVWWLNRRDRRRWDQEQAERERQQLEELRRCAHALDPTVTYALVACEL